MTIIDTIARRIPAGLRRYGILFLWALPVSLPFTANAASAPIPRSGNGISVNRLEWFKGGSRTMVAEIQTSLIVPAAIRGGVNRVYITLPENYFRPEASGKRFPVLYLLHGMEGYAGQWAVSGAVEAMTAGKDVITVMPECGLLGWFTDWADQSAGAQRWESFHIGQLIPWIDANFRTYPQRNGRAVAGNSMGGFGAFHYAFRHPDLFAYAASFSGALDLEDAGTQMFIRKKAEEYGFPGDGPFGPKESGTWASHNPVKHPAALGSVKLAIYSGSGADDSDLIEMTMNNAADAMHRSLNEAGVPHFFKVYGKPGGATGCDGGHNFGCWDMALKDALSKMLPELSGGPETMDTTPETSPLVEVRDVKLENAASPLPSQVDIQWN